MTRTVNLHFDAVSLIQLHEATDTLELYKALAYLSTWNLTFPTVDIYHDGKTDLVASFKNADGSPGYTIGAIWNGSSYNYHS